MADLASSWLAWTQSLPKYSRNTTCQGTLQKPNYSAVGGGLGADSESYIPEVLPKLFGELALLLHDYVEPLLFSLSAHGIQWLGRKRM
jgi:hypothetical protein